MIPKLTKEQALQLHAEGKLVGAFRMTNADYHAAPGISKSALDNIAISPKRYQWALKNPDDLATALIYGGAYHCLLMKDEPFETLYYITKTQPTKPVRDEHGRAPLSEKNLAEINFMVGEAKKSTIIQGILKDGLIETSFFAIEPTTGVLVKTKIDVLMPNATAIDFKTAASTDNHSLQNAMMDRRYHVQGAFGLDVTRLALEQSGQDIGIPCPDVFALISQAKDDETAEIDYAPIDPTSMVVGHKEYLENLETYVECVKTGKWPQKAPEKFVERGLPVWYVQRVLG